MTGTGHDLLPHKDTRPAADNDAPDVVRESPVVIPLVDEGGAAIGRRIELLEGVYRVHTATGCHGAYVIAAQAIRRSAQIEAVAAVFRQEQAIRGRCVHQVAVDIEALHIIAIQVVVVKDAGGLYWHATAGGTGVDVAVAVGVTVGVAVDVGVGVLVAVGVGVAVAAAPYRC